MFAANSWHTLHHQTTACKMNANCKTLVLPLALLLAGLVSTQVAAQEYKEDYNAALAAAETDPVSYTHLTLPTILLV